MMSKKTLDLQYMMLWTQVKRYYVLILAKAISESLNKMLVNNSNASRPCILPLNVLNAFLVPFWYFFSLSSPTICIFLRLNLHDFEIRRVFPPLFTTSLKVLRVVLACVTRNVFPAARPPIQGRGVKVSRGLRGIGRLTFNSSVRPNDVGR